MLVKSDLKLIAKNRLKDARVLMQHKRCSAAVYLAGYMVELYLKLKICHTFKFNKGFPENEIEFSGYGSASMPGARYGITVTKLKQIKCHDLKKLLFYSGREGFILQHFPTQWAGIAGWGPEKRYSAAVVRKAIAADFLKNCIVIIENF